MTLPDALAASLSRVEDRLLALGEALQSHRAGAVEAEAAALQHELAAALEPLRRGAHDLPRSPRLRQRLALASGRISAQRESLARASAAMDRALGVLLPAPSLHGGYCATGLSERPPSSGVLQA